MRRVHDDEPCLGGDLAAQQLDVDRPRGVLAELVEGHLGARRAGDLVQALVARPRHDGVVTRSEHDVGEAEDRLLGTGEDQDIVGLEALVQGRDLRAQERMTRRLRVAEGESVPHRPRLLVGQVEQVGHRVALDIRRAQQVVDGELPAGEIALEREVGDAHGLHHRRRRVSRAWVCWTS